MELRFLFMDALRFATDELTGLWEWPVLLNDDWSQWTEDPCAVLFGETHNWHNDEAVLSRIGELLRARDWPHLAAFRVRSCGLLILASCYSREKALFLIQEINQIVKQFHPNDAVNGKATITWGLVMAETHDWSLPRALQAAVAPVERALREKRYGSTTEAANNWTLGHRDEFCVCSRRDALTNLKSWDHTVALSSHYGDEPVAVLVGDVDHCKSFNDLYGYGMGDVLLQMLAHVLRRFESNDVATFRLAGDEFLIWVRGRSLEQAKKLAEQINTQIRALQIPVPRSDVPVSNIALTWAVVATSPRELGLSALLEKADELLDYAKCEGRGSISAQRF